MTKHKQGKKGFNGSCFVCGERGHMGRDCEHKKGGGQHTKAKTEEQAMAASLKYEGDDEYGVDEYGFMVEGVPEEIETTVSAAAMAAIGNPIDRTLILDSACTTHVVGNRELLTNVREASTRCRVKGIGGDMVTHLIGELEHFGTAYLVDGLGVNLISFAEVEDRHTVAYERSKYMRVQVNKETDITFNRVGKLYKTVVPRHVSDVEETAMVTTVADLERRYSAREVEGARKARQVLRTLAIPSFTDVINMLLKGKILNVPVSIQDLMRAREIYGRDEADIKGKTVNKGTIKFDEVSVPKMMEKRQKLYSDVFNVKGVPFLLSVAMPLDLIVVTHLSYKKTNAYMRTVMQRHIDMFAGKGFTVKDIQVDMEGGLDALRGRIPGVDVEVVGAGMHVVIAERRIRVIKERQRASSATLPWDVPLRLIPGQVYWIAFHLNAIMRKSNNSYLSPREAFTGVRLDYKKDIRGLTFGDYCQVYAFPEPVNSTLPRTTGAIAEYPTGNVDGAWKFYSLVTGKEFTRNHWVLLPTPDIVIQKIESLSKADARVQDIIETNVPENPRMAVEVAEHEEIDNMHRENNSERDREDSEIMEEPDDEVDHEATGNDDREHLPESDDSEPACGSTDPEESPREQQMEERGSVRIAGVRKSVSIKERREMGLHVSLKRAIKMYGKDAYAAIRNELQQMVDRNVWLPVKPEDLSRRRYKRIIRSSMFLKEKFLANGNFEKLKARLVAGGNMQEKELHDSVASPTISTVAVFILLALAAMSNKHIATIDVGAAYLEVEIGDNDAEGEVLMYLEPFVAKVLCDIDPKVETCKDEQGRVVVKLTRALYGLVQSAKLWYEKLKGVLEAAGFTINPHDPCVLNKMFNGKQITIGIHVDDLLVTCELEEGIDEVYRVLSAEFREVKINRGIEHSYLGMRVVKHDHGIDVDMEAYLRDVMKACNISGSAKAAHKPNLFMENEDDRKLNDEQKKTYHSWVMKILYAAKRCRPDVLLTTSYLSSKVQEPREKDMESLMQMLKYLNTTASRKLHFRRGQRLNVVGSVDAAYAVHADGRSRTGILVIMAGATILAKSSKQKMSTKSSTEAEVVALSDGASEVLWVLMFLEAQGHDVKPGIIQQDNRSVITLMSKPKVQANRTKHLSARDGFVRDRIGAGELVLADTRSDKMAADALTKPVVGKQLKFCTDIMLGCPA